MHDIVNLTTWSHHSFSYPHHNGEHKFYLLAAYSTQLSYNLHINISKVQLVKQKGNEWLRKKDFLKKFFFTVNVSSFMSFSVFLLHSSKQRIRQQHSRRSWMLAAVLEEVVALATLSTVLTTVGTAAEVWLCTLFLTPFTTITTCTMDNINANI